METGKTLRSDGESKPRLVLSISPYNNDHFTVKQMLKKWADIIYEAACPSAAQELLSKHDIGVVLCERDIRSGSWIDVLKILFRFQTAPPLIVTSRLADDSLWAEALNRGAYDVLAKPFDYSELLRTVNLAWLRWHHAHDVILTTRTVRRAAAS